MKIPKEAIVKFLDLYRSSLAKRGSVVASWRRRGVTRHGPYYRLTCRDQNGVQRSIYLGSDAVLVDTVRAILQELQRPHRQDRHRDRFRGVINRLLKKSWLETDRHLAGGPLTRKGREVRGWRQAEQSPRFLESLGFAAANQMVEVPFDPVNGEKCLFVDQPGFSHANY